MDDAITSLEDDLLIFEPTQDTLNTIQKLKREIISIRRHFSPIRELMSEILRSESELINEDTLIYMRDVSDHAIRVIESIESCRDVFVTLKETLMYQNFRNTWVYCHFHGVITH